MKKILLKTMLLLCALVVGSSVWGQSYTDVLTLDCATPAPTGTTSTALSATDVATFLNSAAGLSSATNKITCSEKTGDVYKGKGNGGGDIPQQCLKIGKAGGSGKITFTIPNNYDQIDQIVMTCYGWKATSSISVNGGTAQTFTTAQSETTKTFTLSASSRTITINVTTSAVCITEIKLQKASGPTTYSVTYNANGADDGTVPTDATAYSSGATVTVLDNTGSLSKTGYAFGGWNTQNDGQGTTYSAGGTFSISANTTLYAKWNAYTVTAQSNNNTYGTVSLNGYVITATPADGYKYATPAYTVSSGTATVAQDGNEFTVTPSTDCTVTINFEAIPTYTVTFAAEGGTCATSSLEEASAGAGVTLPTATISVAGWEFVGWAESAISNASTRPTLYAAESTYYPTANITLHAVFALADAIDKYAMATSNSDIVDGAKVVISSLGNNKYTLANNNGTLTGITNFTPTDGVITCNNSQAIWTLAISNGNVTIANGGKYLKRSSTTVSVDENSYNWTINESNLVSDRFLVKDASAKYYLEHDGTSWTAFYSNNSPSQNATSGYVGLTIYVEKPNKYDSSPSALVTPTVTFGSSDPVTLYLDGTTTHTNTATKSGSNMAIVYSSSDTSVATVTSEGVVTAKGIGTATITASVDAELGVSTSASDTYIVTVKNATTLAGIKAVATSSTAADFTADLASDLVITYVNGTNAFLQSGNVAVYASCATNDWAAGKKFTGAISGKVRTYYNEYQITALDQTPVAGGTVPEAVAVNITDLTTENYATYEGRRVVINGASVSTAMSNNVTSGGQISVGNNTQSINAPAKGVALTLNEKGNFVGYVGRYSNAVRFYMYDQSWFTKTHNAPQNQDMSFATPAYNLDEETAAVTAFNGQAVTQTTVKGAVTYSIKEGSDAIITSLGSSTGAVVLNGSRGTATIIATAAAAEETDGEGYITPYNELSVEYTITVRPRYTVTFSVNGVETSVREESYNAGVTVPANPSEIGAYSFQGWSNATVATTDTKPTLASLTAGNNYKPSNEETYYAVYAIQAQTGTDHVLYKSYSYGDGKMTVGGSYSDMDTSNPAFYMLHDGGYVESEEFDLSIISKVVVYGGFYGGPDYNKLTIGDGTNTWKAVTTSGKKQEGVNTYTDGTALSGNGKLRITSTCGSSSTPNGVRVSGFDIYKLGPVYGYKGYTTSTITNVTRSMVAGKIGTICLPYAVKAAAVSNAKVYTVAGKTMDGSGNLQYVTISELEGDMTAGVPYIIKATTDNPTFFYVEENPAANASSFHGLVGSFTETKINPNEGNYIFSGGLLYLVDSNDVWVGANRAYIYLASVPDNTPSEVKGINIFADGVDPTAISAPYTTVQSGVYYNLQGQRVENPTHGIYILNGKKVFIK